MPGVSVLALNDALPLTAPLVYRHCGALVGSAPCGAMAIQSFALPGKLAQFTLIDSSVVYDARSVVIAGAPAVPIVNGVLSAVRVNVLLRYCLLYTSDAADERSSVD